MYNLNYDYYIMIIKISFYLKNVYIMCLSLYMYIFRIINIDNNYIIL